MGTSLLRYLELFCNLSNTSHARRTTQTSTAKDIFPQLSQLQPRCTIPASQRRTFQPNLNSANQNWTSKSSWKRKEHSSHRMACQARPASSKLHSKAFGLRNRFMFKFNMAERNQFQASAPTISKPKTASYLKPFLASRNTFHFQ